ELSERLLPLLIADRACFVERPDPVDGALCLHLCRFRLSNACGAPFAGLPDQELPATYAVAYRHLDGDDLVTGASPHQCFLHAGDVAAVPAPHGERATLYLGDDYRHTLLSA